MPLRRFVPALVALAAGVAAAQPGDPLEAPECRAALGALQAQEEAVAGRSEAPAAERRQDIERLQTLRRRAAQACLAGRPDVAPPPGRRAQPPLAVPPVTVPAPPPSPRQAAPARPPARVDPPLAVTSCDSTGCWASDGSRLQRLGPNLVGPRGVCSVHGSALVCQ